MIFIYEKQTGNIKFFYQGDISQIHNFGDDAQGWREAHFPDDPEVIRNPHEYKVVVYNGLPITYQKKPELKLTFNKEEIVGDGEDFAVLRAEIIGAHPLEADRYKNAEIIINNEQITVEDGEEIELASHGPEILISGDMNVFGGEMMRRRITVGEKAPQVAKASEIEAMQSKLKELEAKIVTLELSQPKEVS